MGGACRIPRSKTMEDYMPNGDFGSDLTFFDWKPDSSLNDGTKCSLTAFMLIWLPIDDREQCFLM